MHIIDSVNVWKCAWWYESVYECATYINSHPKHCLASRAQCTPATAVSVAVYVMTSTFTCSRFPPPPRIHIPTYSYIFPHMPPPNRPNYFPCIPNVDWLINILAGGGLSCQIVAIRNTTRAVHSNSVFHVWTTSAKASHIFHKYRRCIYKFKSNFSRSFNITEHLDTIYNGLLIVYLVDIWCREGVIEWGRRWTVILNSINKNRNNRDHSHSNMDRIRVRRTTPKSESNDQRCMWMKDIECIENPTWKFFYRFHFLFWWNFSGWYTSQNERRWMLKAFYFACQYYCQPCWKLNWYWIMLSLSSLHWMIQWIASHLPQSTREKYHISWK